MSSRPSEFTLTSPGSLRLFSTEELLKLPPPEWLIDHVLPEGGMAVLYGPPGAGKTFVALNIVRSVAAGLDWFGHATKQSLPLYVSAEGGSGIGKRVAADLFYSNLTAKQVDVMWLLDTLPLYNGSSEVDRLMERIDEVDRRPGLVVVDTLARCFDGDENQQLDMNRFVSGIDALRREFKCTVLVVHHTRLDGDRERGNTALRGAADTMIEIQGGVNTPSFSIVCNKQKDGANFDTIDCKRVIVEAFDSCVVTSEHGEIVRLIEMTLKQAGKPLHASELLDALKSHEISRATLFRHLRETVKTRQIVKENGQYSLPRVSLVSQRNTRETALKSL